MGRAPCCDKDNVKKGPWSSEEDDKLKSYIEKYGYRGNWIALPQKIGLKRCGKSCRLRWLNYLRPNIKHGGFSEEEDNIICNLYMSIGSRWSIIAAQLPGRTDNDIKNYWNTKLKKKLLGRRKQYSNEAKGAAAHDDNRHGLTNSTLEHLQLHFQLQGLHNNPFSNFYNNPALWPKNSIHPIMQLETAIRASDGSPNLPVQPHPLQPVAVARQDHPQISNADQYFDSSLDGVSPSDGSASFSTGNNLMGGNDHNGISPVSNFPTDQVLDEFLIDKTTSGYAPEEGQMAKLEGLDEMNCTSKDSSMIWWPDAKYSSSNNNHSNGWGSTSVLQFNEMFQDYYESLGYNM